MKPRRSIRNETLKDAFKNFVVPVVANNYNVIALRALWDVHKDDMEVASLNIWSKRKKLEDLLCSNKHVAGFFSCITAMQISHLRLELHKKKRTLARSEPQLDSDDEADDYLGEDGSIPGMQFFFRFVFLCYILKWGMFFGVFNFVSKAKV